MSSIKMNIEMRDGVGSNRVNKLRVDEIIPGVIYKRGEDTKSIQFNNSEFLKVYRRAGSTSIIYLELEGETYPVIIKEIQKHPFKNEIFHIDFQGLNMDEKIKMHIPIYLNNRTAIKVQPSVLTQLLDQIEIECLPGNIPSGANVDVSEMELDTAKVVEDLDIASDETIDILTDLDMTICVLSEPTMEEDLEALEELDALDEEEIDAEVPLVSDEEDEDDDDEDEEDEE